MNLLRKKFGRLTVVKQQGKDKNRNLLWLCKCECGRKTIQRTATLNRGLVKSCGCYLRESARERMLNEGNPMWKGDFVNLISLHVWIKRRKQKPDLCEVCGKSKPQDLANISQKYKRDVKDYEWLCRKCHMEKDGRIDRRKPNGQFQRSGIYKFRVNQPM